MEAKEMLKAYLEKNEALLIQAWKELINENEKVLERYFFDLRISFECYYSQNKNYKTIKENFEKNFLFNFYQLVESQKIEPAQHLKIIELGQQMRHAFNQGFKGESKHLTQEQKIVNGKMIGENKPFKEKLINTIQEMEFSEMEQKRIAQLLSQFNIEHLAKERGVLDRLRHPEKEDFDSE